MPSPTRWQKTAIVGLPVLLGAAFLAAWFAHGAVRAVASGGYGVLSVALAWWVRRQVRRNDAQAARGGNDDD